MRLIGLAVVLVLTSVPFAAEAQEKGNAAEAYRIGPEDQLLIAVWKNDAMSRLVRVRPDGKIRNVITTRTGAWRAEPLRAGDRASEDSRHVLGLPTHG